MDFSLTFLFPAMLRGKVNIYLSPLGGACCIDSVAKVK